MGQIVFIALALIGLGGYSIYTSVKGLKQSAEDDSLTGKMRKGKAIVGGFLGPSILILVGLLLLYVYYQSFTDRPFH